MNNTFVTISESGDAIDEKELMDILSGMDNDLINRQIDKLLAEKGEHIDMDSIKEKAINRLKKGKKKRAVIQWAATAAAVTILAVSTVYAKEIQKTIQSFFGKSIVGQKVVDGDAYFLPEELVLSGEYTLKIADMWEGQLKILIEKSGVTSVEQSEWPELLVAEPGGGKSYTGGAFRHVGNTFHVTFFSMPTLAEFELLLGGEAYTVSLTKAESLPVDESLVVGTPADGTQPLIAHVAASRTDTDSGAGITLTAVFDDPDLKLVMLDTAEKVTSYNREFEIYEDGSSSSSSPSVLFWAKPLMAYDADNNAYELKVPSKSLIWPITFYETDAAPGTPLTLKVPAIMARYDKVVDKITLSFPNEGEAVINKEIDFIIQKAVLKTVKRTSETTAEVTFELNTGTDKTVKISDISALSYDVKKGETTTTDNTAVLTLTFDKETEEAEILFYWPRFIITGNWSIELK